MAAFHSGLVLMVGLAPARGLEIAPSLRLGAGPAFPPRLTLMPGLTLVRVLTLALAASALACGGANAPDAGSGPVTLDLEPSAVLVSEESALIAEAVDIEVDDRGNVLVVDYRAPRVLIVPPDGGEPTVVGRGGEGPGEFRFPRAIGGAGGIVYVFDVSRGNVQRFDYQGTYLGESAFPLNASGIELSAAGRIAYNKWPSESGKLVTVADFEGEALLHVGDLVVAEVEGMNFTTIKEEIARGSIPGVLRNEAIPMLAANGDVWVFQQTEAVLERFDASGTAQASAQLALPEQAEILAFFKERNANLGPGTLFPLRYVADAQSVGDSAWLSWNLPLGQPGIITVHGPDGRMRHRLQFPSIPTTSRFAVDPERSRLYLYVNDESSIVVIDLPEGVVS
jgi:hypothetical protein